MDHAYLSASQVRALPDQEGYYFYFELSNGDTDMLPCWPLDYGWNYPSTPMVIVANGCLVRVRLYEFIDQRGWDYCISPAAAGTVPGAYRYPNEVYIGSSTKPC